MRERGLKHVVVRRYHRRKQKSFPVRERGLKPTPTPDIRQLDRWSFPVRERGLKLPDVKEGGEDFVSFPVRERELKYGKVMGQQVGHTSCSFPCGDID